MATLEERVQALEQEHTQLKKTIELQTIAIRALTSKEAFEKLQETVEKTQATQESLKHDFERQEKRSVRFERQTNDQLMDIKEQLANLSSQQTEEDGKIVGLQTEMRQRFTGIETALTQILERLPEKP